MRSTPACCASGGEADLGRPFRADWVRVHNADGPNGSRADAVMAPCRRLWRRQRSTPWRRTCRAPLRRWTCRCHRARGPWACRRQRCGLREPIRLDRDRRESESCALRLMRRQFMRDRQEIAVDARQSLTEFNVNFPDDPRPLLLADAEVRRSTRATRATSVHARSWRAGVRR